MTDLQVSQSFPTILYNPSRERVVTTNAWAFVYWLARSEGVTLDGWDGLRHWSAAYRPAFLEAVRRFAGLPSETPAPRLLRIAALWLHLDVRPDDRVLLAPELVGLADALPPGAAAIALPAGAADVIRAAGDLGASVLLAPAAAVAASGFRAAAGRSEIGRLRVVGAFGDKLAPAVRSRLYTWVKPDLMLLAQAGDTAWGDPLSPVLLDPPARPALGAALRPPPSAGRRAR